jgi:hypothetical protein
MFDEHRWPRLGSEMADGVEEEYGRVEVDEGGGCCPDVSFPLVR